MPRKSKRKSLPPDALGKLPENVLSEILMCLPLRDAVRTSILSKKWRYNWCRLPQLKLDQTLWETTKRTTSTANKFKFTASIHHIVTHHEGPVSKCTLYPPYMDIHKVDDLIYFLSRKGIQHLVLELSRIHEYTLPYSFFTCLQLRHLALKYCSIRLPPVFKGFDRLISLELEEVEISSECLGSLVSHCALLEHLVICSSDDPVVEISAPKLKSFSFRGDIQFIHLKNVPLLSKVSHESTGCSGDAKGGQVLATFFESIPALEHLQWSYTDFEEMYDFEVPERLPFALNCLKYLQLSWLYLGEPTALALALCFIRSSPHLEELEIQVIYDKYADNFRPSHWGDFDEISASFSDVSFYHLRTVNIKGTPGMGPEMQLIKVLLAKSAALVRMVINPGAISDENSFKILAEITTFPRASSKASVVYAPD